jgi:N6-L-threonylcarbamoyladenine synthase
MILAIETSCDDTAVAVLSEQGAVMSQCLSSQIDTHTQYGGVVPELASRLHCEVIHSLIETVLIDSKSTLKDVSAIAVTYGPGLEGALLVGMTAAKTLACVLNIPLIPVNHMQGHLYAYFIDHEPIFPYLGLIVSGGHTQLVHVTDHFEFRLLGETRDDAVGEAFDKVARQLGLGYPGGPYIEKRASNGNKKAFNFPRAMKNNGYEFSFSGLKTAVLEVIKTCDLSDDAVIDDICASFQEAVCDVLWTKVDRACTDYGLTYVLITGGVAANQALQCYFKTHSKSKGITIWSVPPHYCTDNAVMIGRVAIYMKKCNKSPKFDQRRVSPGELTCN